MFNLSFLMKTGLFRTNEFSLIPKVWDYQPDSILIYIFHFDPTFSVYSSNCWEVCELEFAAFVMTVVKTNAQMIKLLIAGSDKANSCFCSQNPLSVH
jgi:hypothetical protein